MKKFNPTLNAEQQKRKAALSANGLSKVNDYHLSEQERREATISSNGLSKLNGSNFFAISTVSADQNTTESTVTTTPNQSS